MSHPTSSIDTASAEKVQRSYQSASTCVASKNKVAIERVASDQAGFQLRFRQLRIIVGPTRDVGRERLTGDAVRLVQYFCDIRGRKTPIPRDTTTYGGGSDLQT